MLQRGTLSRMFLKAMYIAAITTASTSTVLKPALGVLSLMADGNLQSTCRPEFRRDMGCKLLQLRSTGATNTRRTGVASLRPNPRKGVNWPNRTAGAKGTTTEWLKRRGPQPLVPFPMVKSLSETV